MISIEFTEIEVPIAVSNRHVHLSKIDADILFSENHKFHVTKYLTYAPYFVTSDFVEIFIGKRVKIKAIVIGPFRRETQVEILFSDVQGASEMPSIAEKVEVASDVNYTLSGLCGSINKTRGLMIAHRHVHIPSAFAKEYGIYNGDIVSVDISNEKRSLVFNNVLVKMAEDAVFECHIDFDEGCAAGIVHIGRGKIKYVKHK